VPIDTRTLLILVAVAVLVVVAVLVLRSHEDGSTYGAIAGSRFRRRPHRDHFRDPAAIPEPPKRRVGIVVNPTKFADLPAVKAQIGRGCAAAGWGEPIWHETTVEDPGSGQAKLCVDQGADIVCPLGGDGTVRQVASALVGTETPMGLLPGGTANLLARNLDLPFDDLERSLAVALGGQNKRIDVGWLQVDDGPEQLFLVMAGMGFDGAVMAQTPEQLKAVVGSAAYTVSGFRNWLSPRFRVSFSVDGGLPISRRTRSVVVGNCGKIYGNLVLLPEARVDDGILDAVLISPKGVIGWTNVFVRVVTRRHKGHEQFDHHHGAEMTVVASEPQDAQLDGDTLGLVTKMSARVESEALLVRIGA
jgi:diacylglycerol kinase (ATP)